MMKRNLAIFGALVVVVGVAVVLVGMEPSDPSGRATGVSTSKLWQDLSEHRSTFLNNWAEAFEGDEPDAIEVAEAWSELAHAVAGRSGFWRSQVRKEWFGCGNGAVDGDEADDEADDEVDPCSQLDKVDAELKKWDGLMKQVGNLSERSATRFMRKNEKRMREFVSRYVPTQASASGMKETPVYQEHMAGVQF